MLARKLSSKKVTLEITLRQLDLMIGAHISARSKLRPTHKHYQKLSQMIYKLEQKFAVATAEDPLTPANQPKND